jgi:hypothetical protein
VDCIGELYSLCVKIILNDLITNIADH